MSTDKKEHIIDVALALFAEKGFEGTSIRDIAAKAGVNLAMVNYYFGSKENLFEIMVREKSAYTRNILDSIVRDDTLTEIEKLDRIIDNYIDKLFANRSFHRIIHQELMLNQRESLQTSIVNILTPNKMIIGSIIEKGMQKGVFRKVDTELTIVSIMGTINQVLLSGKMCNRMLGTPDDYVPYEDEQFKQRVTSHLKQLTHAHLLQ
jgi:AcrR family transcriptional regulator